jgi:hypothetical protein
VVRLGLISLIGNKPPLLVPVDDNGEMDTTALDQRIAELAAADPAEAPAIAEAIAEALTTLLENTDREPGAAQA